MIRWKAANFFSGEVLFAQGMIFQLILPVSSRAALAAEGKGGGKVPVLPEPDGPAASGGQS